MSCGCTSTPTTPAQTNTPNVFFTWGVPYRYEGDLVEPYTQWILAESDLYVRFEYTFLDTFEYGTGSQYGNAKIEVSASEDGSSPITAASDSFHCVPFTSGTQFTATVDAIVKKGLYYRIVAICPGTLEDLVATEHSLYEYSSLTLTACVTPVTSAPVTTSCSCDPCAPSGRCNTPPPMPVIVVSGANAGLPACSGPNTFEPVGSFTMPAVESNAPLRVCDPGQYPVGHCVYLSDGTSSATLRVISINTTNKTIQLDNYGAPGAAAPGTVFSADSVLTPIGPCPETVEQDCDRAGWELGEAFTPQAATVDTTMHVSPCISVVVGQKIFVKALGWFEVKSIDDVTDTGTELTVWTSTLLPGVVAGTTTAASGGYVIADEPPGYLANGISEGFNLECPLGSINTLTGGASSVSSNMVLPWDANCLVTGMTFRDPNAGATVETLEYQCSLDYSSDGGSSWTELIDRSMEATNREGNGNPVTKWVQLTAGTYLFRFRSEDMTGTLGAPTPLEPPVYTQLHVAVMAVRKTVGT